jgi:biotin transport system substrate-specific component
MTLRVDRLPGPLLETMASRAELSTAHRAAAVLLMTALTAAAAQVSIPLPFTPVVFTLTPMVVLLGGAALGSRLGMTSQVLYLAAGIAGLPVFAPSAVLPPGIARLFGPTGGYLMAYPFAAWLAGALAERGLDRRYGTSLLAMLAGLVVIFFGGVIWLAWSPVAPLGLTAALAAGFYPFIVADLFKLCVAAAVLPGLWALAGATSRTQDF